MIIILVYGFLILTLICYKKAVHNLSVTYARKLLLPIPLPSTINFKPLWIIQIKKYKCMQYWRLVENYQSNPDKLLNHCRITLKTQSYSSFSETTKILSSELMLFTGWVKVTLCSGPSPGIFTTFLGCRLPTSDETAAGDLCELLTTFVAQEHLQSSVEFLAEFSKFVCKKKFCLFVCRKNSS